MHRLTEQQLLHIIRQADAIPFEKEFVDLLRQELSRRSMKQTSSVASQPGEKPFVLMGSKSN
ncbi:sporulation histidine kinase inhibitor Sda [Paenibacillus allorhizosphaerae]|uniref:Sporulation histidine kinase inhibitor Sda n=1 Tax=Paenibacillus allorhizosphaerae TaxID=2849866 RepID=A0ABM8VIE8_9BACL|nr:sporulation histidine kinase inhibitor Sda [Paenibacillus allorhizosphaerae]CAG7643079.1 hypothetical protein PAECIP111802_02949 [Paenibacillus allorhizosphaerae]